MSSHLFYENLPEIDNMSQFRRDVYYKLLDFINYLNTAKYARKKHSVKINYHVMTPQEVQQMFQDLNYRYYEIYGYEMNFGEESLNENLSHNYPKNDQSEGVYVKIFDETNRADENLFEDFLKSQSVVDHETDHYIEEEQINVINKYPLFNVIQLEREPNADSPYLYITPNIYILNTQLYSIYNLQAKPRRAHRPILRLFEQKENSSWPSVSDINPIQRWYFLDNNEFPGNSVQQDFVRKALNSPDFAILEGPPGSGKTKTICELVIQAIEAGQRVLLCASTHVAVDNVLEKLMDRDEVIAVRIGKKSNKRISPSVKKYLLSERTRTEKERLIEKLTELDNQRNSGQDYYLHILKSDEGESEIQRMILDNANLVCGTMLGILKHPDIEEERNSPQAVFDMLIIDEASKTTFQEFIVPALFCKKWILVGDPKQLSPFVDDMEVRKSIDGFLPEIHQIICKDCFCCWKHEDFNLIVAEVDEHIRDLYKRQLDTLELEYIDLDSLGALEELSNWIILGAQIIIGSPEQVQSIANILPNDAFLRGTGFSSQMDASYEYWKKNKQNQFTADRTKGNFGKLLAWRLILEYGLRYAENDLMRQELRDDMKVLKPLWYEDESLLEKFDKNLSNMKKVAFPSVLELLKEGFYENRNDRDSWHTVIKNGFDESDLIPRYEKLRYNHRMHSQISEFPRVKIYENDALIDNPNIDRIRKWTYPHYSRRSLWISVLERNDNRTNINFPETQVILEELELFLEWSQFNPNLDHPQRFWEVAVLTFYSNQEDLLTNLITRKYGIRRGINEFILRPYNVKITICTGDRFQGHEADVVFISFVKTTSIGFLNSINRLNVGITRPRYQLVMIGNKKFFLDQRISPILHNLAQIEGNISLETRQRK
ncbi:AAA domain-containing protein [Promethearchaeum syntrophicum]|uniref:AAA domain-containing protein n=1 Tax=Promethearchaeum syntrophicum TaxID=2594042 RepID=A0A5B9D5T4_9ARCH|nr:AAA domain-containing protein [Candidatus Prometheoarchaeum syntrophicum]QEE14498.1 ATP-dependent RecD-like DNA helicase [Candidatus Prometheoarchaeum syntrophicum]